VSAPETEGSPERAQGLQFAAKFTDHQGLKQITREVGRERWREVERDEKENNQGNRFMTK
jgi:hypothetical protein